MDQLNEKAKQNGEVKTPFEGENGFVMKVKCCLCGLWDKGLSRRDKEKGELIQCLRRMEKFSPPATVAPWWESEEFSIFNVNKSSRIDGGGGWAVKLEKIRERAFYLGTIIGDV